MARLIVLALRAPLTPDKLKTLSATLDGVAAADGHKRTTRLRVLKSSVIRIKITQKRNGLTIILQWTISATDPADPATRLRRCYAEMDRCG